MSPTLTGVGFMCSSENDNALTDSRKLTTISYALLSNNKLVQVLVTSGRRTFPFIVVVVIASLSSSSRSFLLSSANSTHDVGTNFVAIILLLSEKD